MEHAKFRTLRYLLVLMLAVGVFLGVAAQAQAFPIIFFHFQGISGNVHDSGTLANVGGVIAAAYETSTGAYVGSDVTDSNGNYSIFTQPGTYAVEYTDPLGRYGGQWYFDDTNITDALPVTVVQDVYSNGVDVSLRQALTLRTIVQRLNHPLTKVPGEYIFMQQKADATGHVNVQNAVTNGSGVAAFGGLRPQFVHYLASATDPTGRFGYGQSDGGWMAYAGAATYNVTINVSPAGASQEITPTVPTSAKTTRSANVNFTVSGSFTKAIANGSQIKVLAVKSSGATKSFSGKIKSGGYSATVKLAKGTWKLYALFSGNATFAANDSLNGRTFTVK